MALSAGAKNSCNSKDIQAQLPFRSNSNAFVTVKGDETFFSSSSFSSSSGYHSNSFSFPNMRHLLVYLLFVVALLVFVEQRSVIGSSSSSVSLASSSPGVANKSLGLRNKSSGHVFVGASNAYVKELGKERDTYQKKLQRMKEEEEKKKQEEEDAKKKEAEEAKMHQEKRQPTTVDNNEGDTKDIKVSSIKVCPEVIYREELHKRREAQEKLRKGEAGSKEVLEQQLGSVGEHRFNLKQTFGNNGERYLLFLMAGGLNNALLALENVMPIAAYLNRTLVIPYLSSDHAHGLGGASSSFAGKENQRSMPKERVRLIGNETTVTNATMQLLKNMKFTRVSYKKFDLNSEKEMNDMNKISFQSYFRLNDVYDADKMGWKLRNSAKETPAGKDVKELRVAYMEDNPEFWAEQDIYCPTWSAWKQTSYKNTDEFKFLNEREDILCVGQAFSLVRPIAKGFNINEHKNRMVLFSKELNTTASQVLFNNETNGQFQVGNYLAIHNRRGDWKAACKGWVKENSPSWKVCYPTYEELADLYNKVVTRPEAIRALLSSDVSNEGKNMTLLVESHIRKPFNITTSKAKGETFSFVDYFPTYMATNEKDKNILQGIKSQYQWETANELMFNDNEKECKGIIYPFLRPAIDMLIMLESGAFVGNEFSSFSRRVKYLRFDLKRPSYTIGKV
eukprot:Nk52_evm8s48 gene=Nk52_evmTU8s48